MPIYEYECEACGLFDRLRPMDEAKLLAECPVCGAMSARVMSTPHLRLVDPSARMARERNEKSQHAPHVCSGSCHHRKPTAPAGAKGNPAVPKRQMYTGARPWVIEHR